MSKALGECAENLEPAVEKVERIFTAIGQAAERLPLLQKKERPKMIAAPDAKVKSTEEFADEIPF